MRNQGCEYYSDCKAGQAGKCRPEPCSLKDAYRQVDETLRKRRDLLGVIQSKEGCLKGES